MTIAVVVPTIRPESWETFIQAWQSLFDKHDVAILKVQDGETPELFHAYAYNPNAGKYYAHNILDDDADLIHNFSPAVRNLGFAYIARYMPHVDTIITLDDDVLPDGDTIQQHLDALNLHVPVTWMNTMASDTLFPRGFSYEARHEAEVVLSHGVWKGVADWSAAAQLERGNPLVEFQRIPVPRGVEVPICGMNIAFKRKVLEHVYYAPVARESGVQRYDDIFWGRHFKRAIDEAGYAMVTGYAAVRHERASDPYKNLIQEAVGTGWNETYWERQSEPFFVRYAELRQRWQAFIAKGYA